MEKKPPIFLVYLLLKIYETMKTVYLNWFFVRLRLNLNQFSTCKYLHK